MSQSLDDQVADDDDNFALQRYNSQLPPSYRSKIKAEGTLLLRALRVLIQSILNSSEAHPTKSSNTPSTSPVDDTVIVAEGYEHEFERDYAALEKGVARYLDLKHQLTRSDYPLLVRVLVRGALSPRLDMGLRSKLARVTSRVLQKRQCVLPDGLDWRPILDTILRVHIHCITGGPFIGKEIRDSHCRNMVTLLTLSRNYLVPGDGAEKIWNHFAPKLETSDVDTKFQELLIMAHLLPTRGDVWCGWAEQAMKHWQSIESSSDWDGIWMGLLSRLVKHHPGLHDWAPHLPHIYSRIVHSLRLPLGPNAPQGPVDRRCPHYCMFLLDIRAVVSAASFIVNTLSPKHPETWEYLERLFALIANYYHPSNGGRWSLPLGSFLINIASSLCSRVVEERKATKAGVMNRVFASKTQKAIVASDHRLTTESIESVVKMLLPIVQQAMHAKFAPMALQAASAARDLAIIAPHLVIEPMLVQASESLESISSPHRTTAALRLLSTMTAVFMDSDFFDSGNEYLPQILMLSLPGIDPNDLSKTESTLRFIAAAAGRVQSIIASEPKGGLAIFLDQYVHQLLERIFALLESLEAPPKKGRLGAYPGGISSFSHYIFSVTIENLFAALPPDVAVSTAHRIARQLTGASCMNAMKYYAALLRMSAAAAASALNGSSVNIFIPVLIDQILEPVGGSSNDASRLVSVGEEELVWRIRMLAQACRTCGHGLHSYRERICRIVTLAMEKPSRPVYKAGGRLLRGILEGLTCTRMNLEAGSGTEEDSVSDGEPYTFQWREPSGEEWKCAEDILESFIVSAESLAFNENSHGSTESKEITTDRDVLFRVLRMLHAIQRGGRWVFAGCLPTRFQDLDKYTNENLEMSKADAKLVLKRPVAAGLGGERGPTAAELATKLWTRVYSLSSDIISAVVKTRPDDGALLYRCIEPIELAHEPFRRSSPTRQPLHTSRGYKSVYRPIISSKRPLDYEGGVGRLMPRFIVKLRIEAHHEMRLSIAAHSGMCADTLNNKMIAQLTELSINDFPRVRGEARGVLARALRFTRPSVRLREIRKVIDVLKKAASVNSDGVGLNDTEPAQQKGSDSASKAVQDNSNSSANIKEDEGGQQKPTGDVKYEKIIGTSALLRSSAVAPIIMRDWQLFSSIIRALLDAMLVAERPDAAGAVTALFGKLSSLVRPLGLEPIRIVGDDLRTVKVGDISAAEQKEKERRTKIYNDLNSYLLRMLTRTSKSLEEPENVPTNGHGEPSSKAKEAHWRLQSLVATVLYVILREDQPPASDVAGLFINGMASDVVTLRQISAKAVMFILAVHGRRAGDQRDAGSDFDDSPDSWLKAGNQAVAEIGRKLCHPSFARQIVHTLALDHDDDSEGGRRPLGYGMAGGFVSMNLARSVDGDACWMLTGGKPWPTSWIPRSRDDLSIVRIRLYESFLRVFGKEAFNAFAPALSELIEKLEMKQEKIISGVKDEDVRVLSAELLAGMCRGLDLYHCKDGHAGERLQTLAVSLLGDMTGRMGNVTGGTTVRLICSSEEYAVGSEVGRGILEWLLRKKPIVVPMGDGPVAHLQARRLRYLHASIADLDESGNAILSRFIRETVDDLTGAIGFDHEMKTVREEVARCMGLLAAVVPKDAKEFFSERMDSLFDRLGTGTGTECAGPESGDRMETDGDENADDERRKSRSRQGETLSRFVSIIEWSGRASQFEKFIPSALPCLFASFDESDKERITIARMALSFAAQGRFSKPVIDGIISAVEETAKDSRWKVRSSVLAFLQVFSFVSLFIATSESLRRLRGVVMLLLADNQLEVRQAAASAFVTMIRDATTEAVDEMRETCMKTLASTTPMGRGKKRQAMDAETICRRHGAVLGLSSMVISSPYSVPKWLPSVLVALSGAVNDPPPISTGVRQLFSDFMRTHRDEWQMHKLQFTEEELDIVSELMVSPSYYA